MPSHNGSQHYGSPTRLDGMSSSSSRMSVEGSLRSISKYRIKVVARRPLPNFNFLAPYEPYAPQALAQLQRYIHKQLSLRALAQPQKDLMASIKPESIRLEMDDFAIPLDEPEILRDGDIIEVCLATELDEPEAVSTSSGEDEEMSSESETSESSASSSSSNSSEDSDQSSDESESRLSADEREALLEAKRIAALLRSGVHQTADDDEDTNSGKVRSKPHEDFPKPLSAAPIPKASRGIELSAAQEGSGLLPGIPSFPDGALAARQDSALLGARGGGGVASAMAAFEAQKKARQTDKSSKPVAAKPESQVATKAVSQRKTFESSSSDSDSDSDSDSAPSVEAIKRPPEPATSAAADDVEQTVPPGKGTTRTKRRNLLRRKKLQFARAAENEANFLAAKQRAEEREKQASIEVPTAIVEDVAAAVVDASTSVEHTTSVPAVTPDVAIVAVLPNDNVDAAAAADGVGKKRKRQEASPDAEVVDERYVSARTVPPSELPRDQVPACITITRIDCEAYYDAELRKLEHQQDQHTETDAQLSQPGASADLPLNLDYADTSAEHTARKRVKVEADAAAPLDLDYGDAASTQIKVEVTPDLPANGDPDWAEIQREPPQFYIDTDVAQPFALGAIASGTRVVFRDIALHPTQRLPEVMTFVGVARRCSRTSVELDVTGPLLATATWAELTTEPRTWTQSYHPDTLHIL